MEREEIIVNLKLLESVQKMQKLTTRDVFLNIEPTSLIPECFRRWKRQDGRDTTIKKILIEFHPRVLGEDKTLELINNITQQCFKLRFDKYPKKYCFFYKN